MADTDRRGVLFDVDGTLVDTTYLHALCWTEALRQAGHDVPTIRAHRAIGMGTDQLLDALVGPDRDHNADSDLSSAHISLYKQWWGRLRPLPGAADLLRRCAERGLVVVLASSASEEELSMLRGVIDADDAIAAATSASDADASKPHPDILQVALDRVGLEPAQAVLIGDAEWDGRAAGRAGVGFVGVRSGGIDDATLRDAGAAEIWTDAADLLAGFENSRLAELAALSR